jgi:hypothetical protein
MAAAFLLQSGAPAGTGSTVAAFGLALWACVVALGLVRLVLVGAPCPHAWARLRRPPSARRPSPRRLQRRVLRAVIRAAVPDRQGTRLLPDRVEVLLPPGELRALGPAADLVVEGIVHGMLMLVREGGYRLATGPSVILTAAPTRRSAIRTHLGRRATTMRDGSWPRSLGPGRPLEAAVLRRLEPPGRPLLLRRRHVRVGRRPECDLTIPEPTVSRRHASLHSRVGSWYLLDHGSTNGTFVNGRRLQAPTRLADGDEISLGRRVRLRFERSHLHGA